MKKMTKKQIIGICAGVVAAAAIATAAFIIPGRGGASAFGELETYAGGSAPGFNDGDVESAFFNNPVSIVSTESGILVADNGNGVIRGIGKDGNVATFAGDIKVLNGFGRNTGGYADGSSDEARFGSIGYMCEYDGNIYFIDSKYNAVRMYDGENVSTYSTCAEIEGYTEEYACESADCGFISSLSSPSGIAADEDGNIYVSDTGHDAIIKICTDGHCELFAGVPGVEGDTDGDAKEALFCDPTGLEYANGVLYVADTGNNLIRVIENGKVKTFAGTRAEYDEISNKRTGGNSVGSKTELFRPTGLKYCDGYLFVADSGNNSVKVIRQNGTSSLAFGGKCGFAAGKGDEALLNYPTDIEISDGYIYIADSGNNAIRRATIDFNILETEKSVTATTETLKARQVVITSVVISNGKTNTSFVKRSGEEISCYSGMRLTAGDILVSDYDNAVVFTIDSDKTIRLEPCSEMRIDAVNSKQMTLALNCGAYTFLVENKLTSGENMDFTAGGTTMSIRGTEGMSALLIQSGEINMIRGSISADGENGGFVIGECENIILEVPEITESNGIKRISSGGAGQEFALSKGEVEITSDTSSVKIEPGEKLTVVKENDGNPAMEKEQADISDIVLDFEAEPQVIEEQEEDIVTKVEKSSESHEKCEHLMEVNEEMSSDATCTEDGKTVTVCKKCGYTEVEHIKALGHKEVTDPATEATCSEEGLTEGSHCEVCGEVVTAQEKTDRSEHNLSEFVYNGDATCTVDGTMSAQCLDCGETVTVPDPDHKATGHKAAENGKDDESYCEICGEIISEQKAAEDEHSFTHYVYNNDATCTKDGTKTAKCDNCEMTDTVIDPEHPATGHTEVFEEGKAATCTENGYTGASYCKTCGEKLSNRTVIKATGHKYTNYIYNNDATCTKNGTMTAKCDGCELTKTVSDPDHKATGHIRAFDLEVKPTCTETGLTEGSHCEECGTVLVKQKTIEALDHKFTNYVYNNDATCTKKGTMTAKCDRCEATDTIADPNHVKGGHVTEHITGYAAKCLVDGKHDCYYCSECKKYFTDAAGTTAAGFTDPTIKATGHKIQHVQGKEPTCTSTGTTDCYYCTECKKYFTDADGKTAAGFTDPTIKATGHKLQHIIGKQPTCTIDGTKDCYYCTGCKKYFTDATGRTLTGFTDPTIKATGHKIQHITGKAATCTVDGIKDCYYCTECKKYFTDADGKTAAGFTDPTIKAAGHKIQHITGKAATCTVDGIKDCYYCTECKKYFTDADGKTAAGFTDPTIKAAGHKLQHITAKTPSCIAEGIAECYYCNECKTYFLDSEAKTQSSYNDLKISKTGHNLVFIGPNDIPYPIPGFLGCYYCTYCYNFFADDKGQTPFYFIP